MTKVVNWTNQLAGPTQAHEAEKSGEKEVTEEGTHYGPYQHKGGN